MKFILTTLLFSITLYTASSQETNITLKLAKLSQVNDIPFDDCNNRDKDCGNNLIWNIVKIGKPALLPLIDKIIDTTLTGVRFDDGNGLITLRTGDIAYVCISQIAFTPLHAITGIQFDFIQCGIYPVGVFSYLSNYQNRIKFKQQLVKYFTSHKLRFIKDDKALGMDCRNSHGIRGYYHQ